MQPRTLTVQVEFYNDNLYQNADISGYFFSDSTTLLKRYQFPHGSIVPAGGFLVITQNEYCALI